MKVYKTVIFSLWFLLMLNLIIAIGVIALLNRMTPAIAKIISENDKSLQACEDMLTVIALMNSRKITEKDKNVFFDAIKRAEANITEPEENIIIKEIEANAHDAIKGNVNSIRKEIHLINKLAEVNRNAMIGADNNARRLGKAGAWGVVFLSIVSYACGLLFIKYLKTKVLLPVSEVFSVLDAQNKGDYFRRCSKKDISSYFFFIFEEINSLLDIKNQNQKQ